MDKRNRSLPLSAFFSIRVAGASILGTLVVIAVRALADVPTQLLVLGIFISVLVGLLWELLSLQGVDSKKHLGLLETPFFLSHDREVFQEYQAIARAMLSISQYPDPVYRDVALQRLAEVRDELEHVAGGTIAFEDTETWRLVYEQLLRSSGLYLYRSVAWIKHRDYWQDEPGRQSMNINFELHDAGSLNIERIAIIADELWPSAEALPVERVRQWIHEQHVHGIWIKVLRQSAIAKEPELLVDMGIYGGRAVGLQELDDQCRTVRFMLNFNFEKIREAEDRWKRLSVYATAYRELLDHFTLDE